MATWAYVLVGVILYGLYKWWKGRIPGMPGPWGIPVFGYLPFLGMKMNETLTKLSNTYGAVYQIQLGSQRIVIVNGFKAVKDGLTGSKGADLAARPPLVSYEGFGVFGAPGYKKTQKMYKKLTVQAMTLFGDKRVTELQEAAYKAIEMMLDDLKEQNGQPFDIKPTLYRVVWTIMGFICYGRYFDHKDPQVVEVLQTADGFGKYVMFGVITDYLPWTRPLMTKQLDGYKRLTAVLNASAMKLAKQNFQTWDGQSTRTVADMFRLACQDLHEDEREEEVSDEKLQGMLTNLFGAGFATVSVTIKWAVLFLAKHPEIQDKLQLELDAVLGDDLPTFSDQQRLPYSSAVLAEVYRMSSMAALAMTHMAIRDTTLNDFTIPAETPVVFNLYSSHFDPTVWDNPKEFRPERFLIANSMQVDKQKLELIHPYGLGLRRCGGEHVAKLEIFIFFVSLFHQCHILEAPGEKLDPEDYIFGLGIDPRPFKVIYKSRKGLW